MWRRLLNLLPRICLAVLPELAGCLLSPLKSNLGVPQCHFAVVHMVPSTLILSLGFLGSFAGQCTPPRSLNKAS